MSATGLPARSVYALLALLVGGVAGFYLGVLFFSQGLPLIEGAAVAAVGRRDFVESLEFGLGCGVTASLCALTLPWQRRRMRRGRTWRIAASAVVMVVVSAMAETEGLALAYVLALIVWLSTLLTFTFIRYGLLDAPRRSRTSAVSRLQ